MTAAVGFSTDVALGVDVVGACVGVELTSSKGEEFVGASTFTTIGGSAFAFVQLIFVEIGCRRSPVL